MERLSPEQLKELLSTIDVSDNGEQTIQATSNENLQKMHNGLHGLSGIDTQYKDSKIHAQLIEAELQRRGVPFEPLNWQ